MHEHQPPLIILDRDGVINRDSNSFIKSPEEFVPLPGSIDAIAELCRAGYRVVIASNQSGLGRGLFSRKTLDDIHAKLRSEVRAAGGEVAGIFFCPHTPDDGCDCRKPRPGLLQRIAAEFHQELREVPVVGDSARDLEAAVAVGARPILVRTGNGRATENNLNDNAAIEIYDDLRTATAAIIASRGIVAT